MVKIMVPNPIKMDDLGGPPLFLETPIYIYVYIQSYTYNLHVIFMFVFTYWDPLSCHKTEQYFGLSDMHFPELQKKT